MKKHIQFFLTILFIMLTFGTIQSKELDYSTTQIREMWFICSTELREKLPRIPEQNKIYLCDCYVNHLRENFTSKEVLNLSNEESYKLGFEVSKICKINGQGIKDETFALIDSI